MNTEREISNLEFPIAKIVRQASNALSPGKRNNTLQMLSEDEFVSQQVDIYLLELETAMHAGYDELGAKEIALQACLHAIGNEDGEILEA